MMERAGLIGAKALTHLKARLVEERRQLQNQIDTELSQRDNASSADIVAAVKDRGDESVADLYSDLELAGAERHVQRLSDVEDALYRIKNNEYGVCLECAQRIDARRLDADPAAGCCIRCQTRRENTPSAKDVTPSL